MKSTLLKFIWTYSRRDQFVLIAATVALFPLLYLTLELPKRIINDAISAPGGVAQILGREVPQTALLVALCLAFLAVVLAHGLWKMRVNVMKGVLAERLLRRFRYQLVGRVLDMPAAARARTSEGELVSVITAESEPLGGIMGDALAQPLLQAGQMATILAFLFVQSPWFGLAAIALIPLQAWLIPRMQRRINVLNRARVRQVRALATDIGETSAGAVTLRAHGAGRYRMAQISARLGKLFETRFEIYRRKFFMKFANNFLTQLTPFAFFFVGGLLVIRGQLTLGALIAALSAFKDLSAPWKELLTYYTQVQELSARYAMIVERLQSGAAAVPDNSGAGPHVGIRLAGVSLRGEDGTEILTEADLDLPAGSWTVVVVPDLEAGPAVAELLAGIRAPDKGRVLVGAHGKGGGRAGHVALVARDGYLFDQSIGQNLLLPVQRAPLVNAPPEFAHEAQLTGNSPDPAEAPWVAPAEVQAIERDALRVFDALGVGDALLARVLDRPVPDELVSSAAPRLLALRNDFMKPDQSFAADIYFDDLSFAENLTGTIRAGGDWPSRSDMAGLRAQLDALGIDAQIVADGWRIALAITEAFDADAGTNPLFRQIGLPAALLPKLHQVCARQGAPRGEDIALMRDLVLHLPVRRLGLRLSGPVREAAKRVRQAGGAVDRLPAGFVAIDLAAWHPALSLFENLAFARAGMLERHAIEPLRARMVRAMRTRLPDDLGAQLMLALPAGRGGALLGARPAEALRLVQGVVQRPAALVLDAPLPSFGAAEQARAYALLREMLPDVSVVQIETAEPDAQLSGPVLELSAGRFRHEGSAGEAEGTHGSQTGLQRKLAALAQAPLFASLPRKQQRMLAFSARWIEVPAGSTVFRKGDPPDGAFLLYEGRAQLIARNTAGKEEFRVDPEPGTLLGELGLIRNDPRRLDMVAVTDLTLLRIDAADFLSLIESDAGTAFRLIRVLMDYLDRPA